MSLYGKNLLAAQQLLEGEPIDTQAMSLKELVEVLGEVNDVLSSERMPDGARAATDQATLDAVRRLASEAPEAKPMAHDLVYCLIGMDSGSKKTEAFETLFPHLPLRGKADALNDLLAQINDAVMFGEADKADKADELTGLLAKYARKEGHPLQVQDVQGTGAVFSAGRGEIVFHPGGIGPSPPGYDDVA